METIDSLFNEKGPKKSPPILRILVLAFALVSGVYICTTSLKQTSNTATPKFLDIQDFDSDHSCDISDIDPREIPYLHYPKPETFDRSECACNAVRYFTIVSMQRSGSGWFETLLNSHMNVSSNGEIFGVRDRRANASSIIKILDQVYNLDWLSSGSKNECSAAIGLKWMLGQGLITYRKDIAEYFERNGVHVIFLFRRNSLRRKVSVLANSYDKSVKPLNGIHKSHVHSVAEAKILAKYKPKINIATLLFDLKKEQDTIARTMQHFKNTRHIVLYYEDVVRNHNKLKEVQKFLRLPYQNLTSRQVKIHTKPLSKQVENWKDIRAILKGTSYESFLNSNYQMQHFS